MNVGDLVELTVDQIMVNGTQFKAGTRFWVAATFTDTVGVDRANIISDSDGRRISHCRVERLKPVEDPDE